MSNLSKTSRGFTLIELLVVIGIISILATLLLLQLGVARAKARDAKRIADINQVRSAVELYFDANGSYFTSAAVTFSMAALKPTYLTSIPNDPSLLATCGANYTGAATNGLTCYGYLWNPPANPTQFHVYAELERKNTNALGGDGDAVSVVGWGGSNPRDGSVEACAGGVAIDCLFDFGQ